MTETTQPSSHSTSFRDSEGRTWNIFLTAPLVKMIRADFQINLTDLSSDPFEKLAADPVTLVDILYLMCRSQAEEQGVSDEMFGSSLGGDAIDDATNAMAQAIVAFSPASRRSLLQSLLTQNGNLREKAMKRLEAKMSDEATQNKILDRVMETTEKELNRALEAIGSDS